jgi:sigma-E factor negative regulatory protein RseC
MLEQRGKITARHDGQSVWVELEREGGCSGCHAATGCGQRLFRQSAESRFQRFLVEAPPEFQVGDNVLVQIDESAVLRASLLVYGLPLLVILLALLLGSALGLANFGLGILSLLAALIAAFCVKTLSSRLSCNPRYHPQLLAHCEGPAKPS